MRQDEDDYALDAELTSGPTDAQLREITELARQQLRLEDQVAEAEATLADLQARLKLVAEVRLPDALTEAALEDLTLTGGYKVGVKRDQFGAYDRADAERVFDWLRENGHGDLVKRKLEWSFGRDQDQVADLVRSVSQALLAAQRQEAKLTDAASVHAQTFMAFTRSLLRDGGELPDFVTVVDVRRAKITRPRGEQIS